MTGSPLSLVETLPLWALPPSAAVDALQMAARIKPALRTRLAHPAAGDEVAGWSERHGLACCFDDEDYVCVAVDRSFAVLVLEIDRQSDPHANELGRLLGYPACCCEIVAQAGEDRIDELAAEAARWTFEGGYRLIDHTSYLAGRSLVCHVPCSPTCDPSLALARAALDLVRVHRHSPGFRRWKSWVAADDLRGMRAESSLPFADRDVPILDDSLNRCLASLRDRRASRGPRRSRHPP